MAKTPVASDQAGVDLYFDVGGDKFIDVSNLVDRCSFKATMNGGYVIAGRLLDAGFNITKRLFIDSDYFNLARSMALRLRCRFKWRGSDNVTKLQTAFVTALVAGGDDADIATIEFIAIDPPSWYLNTGNASGKKYSGRVCDAIKTCVGDYAPGVAVAVSETLDSKQNGYWMMGQDPKTFIVSLLEWSAPLTRGKTMWLVSMDGMSIAIKEQADIQSRDVAFYAGPRAGGDSGSISRWKVVADNGLSILSTKLVTQGISAVSGQYIDRVTDQAETFAFVKDSTTPNKYKAAVSRGRSFAKPPDGKPPQIGWTAIPAVPEVYSANDIGLKYQDYIDGRARSLWLNLNNMVLRAKFTVIGHGIYDSSMGLGTDTLTVQWIDVDGNPFFLAGNWMICGFEHLYRPGSWTTDVYCMRQDFDDIARAVPKP